MTMLRWEPADEALSLREAMNQLLADTFVRPGSATGAVFPVDVHETDNELVVKAVLPGVKSEDIDISITTDVLTIQARCESDRITKNARYHRQERSFGNMIRSFGLPTRIQPDKVDASFENDVLQLTMPKSEDVKPRTIKIKTGSASTLEGATGKTAQPVS